MKTITTPNHDHRITKIIAEIRGTCIEGVDIEVIEDILLRELDEYCRMLDGYYNKEYGNTISLAHNSGYVEGHSDGYKDGYDAGYDDGYEDGYSKGYSYSSST